MAEIILTPDAETTLQNLIEVLHKKEHFGFRESCHNVANLNSAIPSLFEYPSIATTQSILTG